MTAHLELTDTVNSSGQVSASAVTVLQSTLPITLIVTTLIIVTTVVTTTLIIVICTLSKEGVLCVWATPTFPCGIEWSRLVRYF